MMNRRMVLFFLVIVTLLVGAVQARQIERLDDRVSASSKHDEIKLKIDIDAARIRIQPHEGDEIVEYKVRYDADKYDVDVDYEDDGDVGEVTILQEKRGGSIDYDSDDSRWTISLSDKATYDMNLDIGFAECRADLTGIPISNLRIDIGAAEGRITFDDVNPMAMESFDIDAGAGEFDFIGLGFANAGHYEFDGGAGEFTLDFTGFTDGFHTANVDIGVGEVTVELPEDLPVRIEADDGWFNELNIRGREFEEVRDGVYETAGFDKGKFGLEIELDVGMGEATIRRADSRIHFRSGDVSDYVYTASSLPGLLKIPAIPARPAAPAIISIPPIPAIPARPAAPAIISIPPIPAIPARPAAPAIISIPPIPAIPARPAAPAIIAIPPMPPIPAVPAMPTAKATRKVWD